MVKGTGTRPPKNLNHDEMKALLERNGWVATIGGKHSTKMEKPGRRCITLPRHKNQTYGRDLRAQLLREAGLQVRTQHADEPRNDVSGGRE